MLKVLKSAIPTPTEQSQSAKSQKAHRCRFRNDRPHSIERQFSSSRLAGPGTPDPLVNIATGGLGNFTVYITTERTEVTGSLSTIEDSAGKHPKVCRSTSSFSLVEYMVNIPVP